MNKIIFTIVFLFTSLSLFAQSTRYDVLKEEKEVWVYPMIEVKLDLIFSTYGVDHFIKAELNPYSSNHNKRNLEKLKLLYPDYKVQLYPVVLKNASIDFKDSEPIPFNKWPTSDSENKAWPLSTELSKLYVDNQEEVFDQINTQEVFNIKFQITKEGREKLF